MTSRHEFGIRITIDGVAVGEISLTPALPAHPDNPGVPTGIQYTTSSSALVLSWTAPLDWGNEDMPLLPRRYLIRYQTDHTPDDQDSVTSDTTYTIPADGADRITLLGLTAENAARRRSHEVLLPVPISFAVYSRIYGPQYGPQYG